MPKPHIHVLEPHNKYFVPETVHSSVPILEPKKCIHKPGVTGMTPSDLLQVTCSSDLLQVTQWWSQNQLLDGQTRQPVLPRLPTAWPGAIWHSPGLWPHLRSQPLSHMVTSSTPEPLRARLSCRRLENPSRTVDECDCFTRSFLMELLWLSIV